jgi:hypothetical protein
VQPQFLRKLICHYYRKTQLRILPNLADTGSQRSQIYRNAAVIITSTLITLLAEPTLAQNFKASGFGMRNHAPFSALIGIPNRWPDGTDHSAEISWNTSNHSMLEVAGDDEYLMLDGETQTLSARLQKRLSSKVQLGIDIPWLQHSGGYLDGLIDSWHDLFGLPDGIRPQTPDNELMYVYENNGVQVFQLDERKSGLGDIQLAMGLDFGAIGNSGSSSFFSRIPWNLTFNLKVPTGDVEKLTGSGNIDVGAGVGMRSPGSSRLDWWLDVGLVWPGDVDIAGLDSSGQIYYYDGAVTWRMLKNLDVLLQLAGHTALYQANVTMLGEPAMLLAAGTMWHVSERYALRLGFFEDLRAESAPDFGIEMAFIFKHF